MKKKLFLLSCLFILLCAGTGFAGEDAVFYSRARKAARAGSVDFAFMNYRKILREYPRSRFTEEALFAKGEYHFLLPAYPEATAAFAEFLSRYPDSNARLFALAYLFKIAETEKNRPLANDLRKKIITLKQVSLVFRKYAEYKYLSPLNREFTAVFHIDKIGFYVSGELFAEISY